jgi:hypothetical protein
MAIARERSAKDGAGVEVLRACGFGELALAARDEGDVDRGGRGGDLARVHEESKANMRWSPFASLMPS